MTNIEEGYENIIVSESETQIARLRDIFSEINPELSFKSKINKSPPGIYRLRSWSGSFYRSSDI